MKKPATPTTVKPGLALLIDSEQADLVRLGAEVMIGALDARIQRADPDRVISSSYKLQRMKLEQLQLQLRPREATPWADLDQHAQGTIIALASVLSNPDYASRHDESWQSLATAVWTVALRLVPPDK